VLFSAALDKGFEQVWRAGRLQNRQNWPKNRKNPKKTAKNLWKAGFYC